MDKPPLLLLHGALGSSMQLHPLAKELHNNFQIFQYNFPGHGGEEMSKQFRLNEFCEGLKAHIETQNLRGCFVFGYSMGGYVALKLSAFYPGTFKAIATLGTKMEWSEEIAQQEIKQLNPEVIEEKVPQFARALQERHQPNSWKEVLHKTADFMMDLGLSSKLTSNDFQQITIPVQIGIGDKDRMVGLQESQDAAEQLPYGNLQQYVDFKHPIEQIDVKVLSDSLQSYFQSIS